MVTVFDVASFIVARVGAVQPMKLQKLVYYAQAWSIVRDGVALFSEPLEAWRYGPVCPDLYNKHRGSDAVPIPYPYGNPAAINANAQQTIIAVVRAYGAKSPSWLSDLTHREDPWKDARGGLPLDARGTGEITHEAMRAYYGDAESIEKRQVMSFGKSINPLISHIEGMSDDDAAVIDELSKLDQDPGVAKLSV